MEKLVTRTCPHRMGVEFMYVNNDGVSPPVIAVSGAERLTVISLTNQTIRVSCPLCFDEIRRAVSILTPETWKQLPHQ